MDACFERSRYLPPNFPTTGEGGTVLPRMPEMRVKHCLLQYGPNIVHKLFPHQRNKNPSEAEENGVDIQITQPLEIGYGHKQQTVVATVQNGREEIRGKDVVLRFFDPVYVSPEQVRLIPHHGTLLFISSGLNYYSLSLGFMVLAQHCCSR